jgi:hypothetical protein
MATAGRILLDVDASLLSGPTPGVEKLVDANVQKGGSNGRVDGPAYTFDVARWSARICFASARGAVTER